MNTKQPRLGSLFSGYGGLDLAVESVLGASTAWVSDNDKGARKILAYRFPDAPNLGDITKIRWADVEPVDIVTGGFPCQDVSHAGKRAGMNAGTRTGLWSYMRDAIDQLRPRLVVAENVRGLLSAEAASDVEPCPWCLGDDQGEPPLRALGAVLADLADIGYDAQWCGLRAADVGAPHGRFRVFVVAYPAGEPWRFGDGDDADAPPADSVGRERAGRAWGRRAGFADSGLGPANPDRPGPQGTQPAPRRHLPDGRASADSSGDGWDEGRTEPAWELERPDAPLSGDAPTPDAFGGGCDGWAQAQVRGAFRGNAATRSGSPAWGIYAPAIARWEQVLGRPAPAPLRPDGRDGAHRLNPAAVEFLMGLPAGWVMDVPDLTRSEQLKAFGNGVVPQQAAAALVHLLSVLEVAA